MRRRPVEIVVQFVAPRPCDASEAGASGDEAGPVALVHGWGHVRLERLAHAFAGCSVTIRPVVDTSRVEAVDGYRVPDAMRLALDHRFPVDAFPYGTRRSGTCDADHTVPYERGGNADTGQTRLPNLAPLSRFTHRLKTHGGWRLEQPEPGVLIWTSPVGYRYLVTRDGTVLIDRPPPSRHDWWRTEPPDHDEPPEYEAGPSWLAHEPPDEGSDADAMDDLLVASVLPHA